jgi:hypothetical protein
VILLGTIPYSTETQSGLLLAFSLRNDCYFEYRILGIYTATSTAR